MRDRIRAIKRIVAMRNAFFAAIAVSIAMLLSPLALAPVPALAQTQTVVIDCLPPWETNNRFLESTRIKHPGLSLNGFDCGNNCAIGYGLKQVLEGVYGKEINSEIKDVFEKMISLASKPLKFGQIDNNSAILQSRGFVALTSYVLENNDYNPTILNPVLPSATVAVNNFRTALLKNNMWEMNKDITDDGVKWTESVTNVARAIDFYLALENAYKHYNIDEFKDKKSNALFSQLEKDNIMNKYSNLIWRLNATESQFGGFLSRFGLEPGNAPLKIQVAAGYASLTWQKPKIIHNGHTATMYETIPRYIPRAFKAAGESNKNDSKEYWNYQSDSGKYFWAEGPYYFHITLSDIIPFWHAVRINNLLSNTSLHSYNFADPFRQNWFINPFDWLADISTPDGKTPPIDDGNKQYMYNADLLRWNSEYGDDGIGEKFARIVGSIKATGASALQQKLYPVAISIPRRIITDSALPDGIIGNKFDDRKDGENGRQEVVLRKTTANGRQHYILLNGESDDAIERGEGHEQGDQMQLLYYVDDISYLIDSGYDKPAKPSLDIKIWPPDLKLKKWRRSTWNNYHDHNVMWMLGWNQKFGDEAVKTGVSPPFLKESKLRIVSDHQNVNSIYQAISNKVYALISSITLKSHDEVGNLIPSSDYFRLVFFIADDNDPYLIDINSITSEARISSASVIRGFVYNMNYFGNSNNVTIKKQSNEKALIWNNLYKSEKSNKPDSSDAKLFIQPFVFEWNLYDTLKTATVREAYFSAERGIGVNTKTLRLSSKFATDSYSTVSFIQALDSNNQIPDLIRPNIPKPVSTSNSKIPFLPWQYFTWQRDTSTVDVLAVRYAKQFLSPSLFPNPDSSVITVYEADSARFYFPKEENFGFVRLVKNNSNKWVIDDNYYFNLKKYGPPPLISRISGPECLDSENSSGRFVSSTSGGIPPYSYIWSSYRICTGAVSVDAISSSVGPQCNAWSDNVGITKSVDYSGYDHDDFKIRVEVTDSSSPQQSVNSDILQVSLLASSEGSCSVDIFGKTDLADLEQMFTSQIQLPEMNENIPEAYALRQNFPNPFNPSTEILFDLPETAMVSLFVYDVLGREVTRLVENELSAGFHRARFDAGNLPSGVYLYRIQAGNFQDTGRMLLLK